MTPPTTVAFDLMDTVVRDPFREALEAGTGLSLEELFRRKDTSAWPAFERGELTEAQYWQHFRDAGIDFDPEAFHRARLDGYAWIDGMPELLDELAGRVRRVVASNYPVWIEALAQDMLAGRFEQVVASYHLRVRKPEPDFYRRLLVRVGATPDGVVFVDDREVNVVAAREAGLRAHHFVGVQTLRAWLAGVGVAVADGTSGGSR